MGLDWRPLVKPIPGFENRFQEIFRIFQGTEKQSLSVWDKLKGRKLPTNEQLLKEWFANSTPSYEIIKAPRVGRDQAADEWLKREYEKDDRTAPWEEFLQDHKGYYVIELAEELDGVPVYIAMGQDLNVFRGQFLNDCKDLIGENLLNEAWRSRLAEETVLYGQQLMEIADKLATEHQLTYLKLQRTPPDSDPESIESKIHILYAAAKWLLFYGRNGHGYEADY
jgi:hypothetical protein